MKTNIKCNTCYSCVFPINTLINKEGFNEEDILHILFLSTITKQITQLTYVIKILKEMSNCIDDY